MSDNQDYFPLSATHECLSTLSETCQLHKLCLHQHSQLERAVSKLDHALHTLEQAHHTETERLRSELHSKDQQLSIIRQQITQMTWRKTMDSTKALKDIRQELNRKAAESLTFAEGMQHFERQYSDTHKRLTQTQSELDRLQHTFHSLQLQHLDLERAYTDQSAHVMELQDRFIASHD